MVSSRIALLVALAVISAQLSIVAAPADAQPGSGVTGWWAGVAPDAGLTYDDGTCSQDVTFVLQEQAGVVTGDLVAATTASGVCQPLRSVEQSFNLSSASDISGSLSAGVLSLRALRVRTNNSLPNQVLAVIGTGVVLPDGLTITGNIVGARTWLDADGDRIPDCDLALVAANGECGLSSGLTPFTMNAVRLDSPALLLDFESAGTGATIITTPLVAGAGTVVASAPGGGALGLFNAGSGTGSFLNHDQFDETGDDSGQLAFDFDVSSITLTYDGFGAGQIVVAVLDANFNVIGSFFDPDTAGDRPGGPITLSAPGIRYLQWYDSDPSRVSSGIDNVSVSVGLATPADQIDEIADAVSDLTADGVIDGGATQSLTTRLGVAAALTATDPDGAIGVLRSFVRQVETLVRRGVLSGADGQALIDAVQEVIATLQS
jgi:hypothetical protein